MKANECNSAQKKMKGKRRWQNRLGCATDASEGDYTKLCQTLTLIR